jgi:hypothetical protein
MIEQLYELSRFHNGDFELFKNNQLRVKIVWMFFSFGWLSNRGHSMIRRRDLPSGSCENSYGVYIKFPDFRPLKQIAPAQASYYYES